MRTGSLIVGIDLGTTNSAIAHVDSRGRAKVVPKAEGRNIRPPVVQIHHDWSRVTSVLMVVGSTRMPRCVDLVRRLSRKPQKTVYLASDVSGGMAGAALAAAQRARHAFVERRR